MEKFLNGLEYEILKDVVKEEEYTGIEYDSRKIKTGKIFLLNSCSRTQNIPILNRSANF